MLKDVLKSAKRRAQFGLAKVNPATAIEKIRDMDKLNFANQQSTDAVNKTGFMFARRILGDPRARGYDKRVQEMRKSELEKAGRLMGEVSENNRKRLERLNNIQ